MLEFIRKLLGFQTRTEIAAERAAVAMENIADDMEHARDLLRARIAEERHPEQLPAVPALEERETRGRQTKVVAGNGHAKQRA